MAVRFALFSIVPNGENMVGNDSALDGDTVTLNAGNLACQAERSGGLVVAVQMLFIRQQAANTYASGTCDLWRAVPS